MRTLNKKGKEKLGLLVEHCLPYSINQEQVPTILKCGGPDILLPLILELERVSGFKLPITIEVYAVNRRNLDAFLSFIYCLRHNIREINGLSIQNIEEPSWQHLRLFETFKTQNPLEKLTYACFDSFRTYSQFILDLIGIPKRVKFFDSAFGF